MSEFAAVVLAGGAARRMGGAAKPALPVAGTPLLARVLAAAEDARPRIVVGPLELTPLLPHGVSLTFEDPPGGGPVAGLAAGVGLLTDAVRDVAVLAADLPFLSPAVLSELRSRLGEDADAAVLTDDADRPQWLCSVWRYTALVDRLVLIGDPRGRSLRELVSGMKVAYVHTPTPSRPPAWFDCDTDEDIRRAEEWARGHAG
jgi:molybdopterin-guanine dinucleotide biosynthesis protein A